MQVGLSLCFCHAADYDAEGRGGGRRRARSGQQAQPGAPPPSLRKAFKSLAADWIRIVFSVSSDGGGLIRTCSSSGPELDEVSAVLISYRTF